MAGSGRDDPLVVGRIVGDVLDPFVRITNLSVSYGARIVSNGCELKPSMVTQQPRVVVGGNDMRTFYTLTRMLRAQATLTLGSIYTGQEVMCYESPRPTMGIHRLVFVLFQQLGRQTVYAPGWRQNFNTKDFAELYNLGSPVAAVYFNCQREAGSGGRRIYP
uniref:RFT1 homolog n=1 Tax=Oryza glumipatula TaxID=40148 RepID=A0A0E0A5C1_9ORYZ